MSIHIVATISPKPGRADAVREAFSAAIPKVHEEPGCELYALHEGGGEFVMVERWESLEALKVHGKAEALTRLGAALAGKLQGAPVVRRLAAVPAGDGTRGQL